LLQSLRLHVLLWLAGIDDAPTLRVTSRQTQIALPDACKKGQRLVFKAVAALASAARTLQAQSRIDVEQQREVGLQAGMRHVG
jgi:hypothetical protein